MEGVFVRSRGGVLGGKIKWRLSLIKISGGVLRGRRITSIRGLATRPTSDKVRQALFNILCGWIEDKNMLDLFAGSGSVGLEALSRGALKATFVDSSQACIRVLKENVEDLSLADNRFEIIRADFTRALSRLKSAGFDFVFVDPPYQSGLAAKALEALAGSSMIKRDGLVVVQHWKGNEMPEKEGTLTRFRQKRYGNTVLSFYKVSML